MKKKKLSRDLKMLDHDRKFWARNKRAANRMFGTEITNRTSERTRTNFKLSTIAISNDNRTRTTMAISNDNRTRTAKHFRTMAKRKNVTPQVRLLPCTPPNISPTIPIIDGRSQTVSEAVTWFIVGSIALALLYFLVRSAINNIPFCRELLRRVQADSESSSTQRSRKTSSAVRLMSRDVMV